MQWIKNVASYLLGVVIGLIALFVILLVGHVVIVAAMLTLSAWLIVHSLITVYKTFIKF